ncbi:MAG: hypothetical protein J6V55_05230 [Alistipes sp.]|nr:hypothetical protein [Alistipes sp.]
MAKLISTVIVKQALEWLGKMGIKVEPNPELNLYEFEFGDAFVIMHADTPEGVLSFTCTYSFEDETSTMNRSVFDMAKGWWSEYTSTEYCFCEFVDNDCAYVCGIYDRNYSYSLRKYELLEMLNDVVSKWELLIFAIYIAEKTIQKA